MAYGLRNTASVNPTRATELRNYGVCEQTNKSRSNSFGFGYQIAIVVQPLDLTQNIPTSLSSLARIYRAQGKLAEAEPLFKRALEIYEKKLGAEHPSVAATIGELAVLAFDREQFVEAEILKRRGLAIEEKKYGSENATVAYSQRWLARILLAHRLSIAPAFQIGRASCRERV